MIPIIGVKQPYLSLRDDVPSEVEAISEITSSSVTNCGGLLVMTDLCERLRLTKTGFTLVEVLMAAAIFAMAMVFIVPANVLSISVYQRYVNRLTVQSWASDKIWEVKQDILESESIGRIGEGSGTVEIQNRDYEWRLRVEEIDPNASDKSLVYAIRLEVLWPEGRGRGKLARNSYLVKIKQGLM